MKILKIYFCDVNTNALGPVDAKGKGNDGEINGFKDRHQSKGIISHNLHATLYCYSTYNSCIYVAKEYTKIYDIPPIHSSFSIF